jgi:predicted Zn-dependent protease
MHQTHDFARAVPPSTEEDSMMTRTCAVALLLTWVTFSPGAPVPESDPAALLKAAREARRAGNYDEAEKYLMELEKRKGDDEAARLERLLLRGQQGDPAAEKELRATIKTKEAGAADLALEALALGYLATYRHAEAARALDQWLELEPKSTTALALRGRLRERAFRMADAEADYQRALELDPGHRDARLRLAELLLDQARATEALPHFERLSRVRKDDPAVVIGLARCRFALGQVEEATKLLDDLLARHPKLPDALRERGKVALAGGDTDKALVHLRRAEAAAPYDVQTAYQLAKCLKLLGKEEEAKQQLARLERLQADGVRVAKLATQIERSGDDAALFSEMGVTLLRLGQERPGVWWLERALRSDPAHAATHRALADYYDKAGDKEAAERHRKLAEKR